MRSLIFTFFRRVSSGIFEARPGGVWGGHLAEGRAWNVSRGGGCIKAPGAARIVRNRLRFYRLIREQGLISSPAGILEKHRVGWA